jgi:hypothetical protein
MKPQARFVVILVTLLCMAFAYLGGALAADQTAPPQMSRLAPAITPAQGGAIAAAISLLLEDDAGMLTYLPTILRQ